jgi:glycine cleavage system protein P-like pyridoxal-binding family
METESKGILDKFVNVVNKIILEESYQEPQKLKDTPINTLVKRLNEVKVLPETQF